MDQLVQFDLTDWKRHLILDDPVRPHIPLEWRLEAGREVYCLEDSQTGTPRAVLCVAYTDDVALTEQELDRAENPNTAMFYTVWSYDRGAGREIIFSTADVIRREKPHIRRYCTLSPLTEMAERFHTRNGAQFLQKGETCQNFEYKF